MLSTTITIQVGAAARQFYGNLSKRSEFYYWLAFATGIGEANLT